MTLTREQLVVLCERRDMGIVADAASTHLDARRLLTGIPPEQIAVLSADGRRAVQQMVEANLGLVGLVLARHAKGRDTIRDDLFQEGVIGLITAAWRYDPTRTTFSTYAYPYVRGAVLTSLLTGAGELHLRPGQAKDIIKVRRAGLELESTGRPASPAAIAAELGRPVKEISEIMSYTRHFGLSAKGPEAADTSERALAAFDEVLRLDVARHVRMLPPLEQQVIDRLYGLNGQTPSTRQTIAEDLGTSVTNLRRIAISAHAHLRKLMDRPESQPVPGLPKPTFGAGRIVPGAHRPEHRSTVSKPVGRAAPRL